MNEHVSQAVNKWCSLPIPGHMCGCCLEHVRETPRGILPAILHKIKGDCLEFGRHRKVLRELKRCLARIETPRLRRTGDTAVSAAPDEIRKILVDSTGNVGKMRVPFLGSRHVNFDRVIQEAHLMAEANAQTVEVVRSPLRSVTTAMATAAEAVRDGASDAVAKVKQAVPVTGEYVSRFVYSSFYYLSYGVVFPTLLVTNFIPGCGPIADGLVDGATAANDVILEMKEKTAARKAANTEGSAVTAKA
jgi:hypothetical protein